MTESKSAAAQPAATVTWIESRGDSMDPCEVLAVAMVLAEFDEKGAGERIACELGGTEAVAAYSESGPGAMAREVGESHVFDFLAAHPELVERSGCKVVSEPAPPSAKRALTWEDMEPRLAAVGLVDFPAPQSQGHASYALMGPGGDPDEWGFMSADDALAFASKLYPEAGTAVEVCEQVPVEARIDGDSVLDDVLEGIYFEVGEEKYEKLYDGVSRDEIADLTRRLTACLNAWMQDVGVSLDGEWHGTGARRFRRALDGTWEEVG